MVPDQAVTGALQSAHALGAGPYLAVAFGIFVLGVLLLQHRHQALRDREHRAALSDAYALVRMQNETHLAEQRELAKCTQQGLNGALLSIQQTNAGLVHAGMQMVAELKPVLAQNVAVLARAERVMDSRLNGHAS